MKRVFLLSCCFALVFSGNAFAKNKSTGFSLAPDAPEKKFKEQKILKQDWSQSLKKGSPSKRYYPELSSPTLNGDTVYIGTQGMRFYAVNAETGKEIWEYENEDPISSKAVVVADQVIFTDLGGKLVCLNKDTGSLRWQTPLGNLSLGKPLVINDQIFLLKGEQEILSLSLASGQVLWSKTIRGFVKDLTMHGQSSLVHDGQSLYVGLADGNLYKLAKNNGKVLWDTKLTVPLQSFKDIDARVVVDGDSLYVGGYFGAFYRVRKTDGRVLWSAEVGTGVPALVLDDLVVVSSPDGVLYGLEKSSGDQLWMNELNESVTSTPVLVAGKIFVSSFNKKAYVLDPLTGQRLQSLSVGTGAITRPIVHNDQVYLLNNSARLMRFVRP
ncbi:MAG: PQQ-binding-like beta-propeller repeat protein [Deltaproteobacteria bacterium]|nr:PQQ-binding-like beta-propeller repeat protein [Deltaproteobacteria bacterium]